MSHDQDTVLEVQGMTCPSCVRHVTSALRDLGGVAAVDVALREGRVTVTHDTTRAPITHLIAALADAGYVATPGREVR